MAAASATGHRFARNIKKMTQKDNQTNFCQLSQRIRDEIGAGIWRLGEVGGGGVV